MDPERWREIDALFTRALELEGSARTRFLRESCQGDDRLFAEVAGLLLWARTADAYFGALARKIGPFVPHGAGVEGPSSHEA